MQNEKTIVYKLVSQQDVEFVIKKRPGFYFLRGLTLPLYVNLKQINWSHALSAWGYDTEYRLINYFKKYNQQL